MWYSIGIGITFFLVLILISKKNKNTADKILAAWLFIIGIHLLLYYLYVTEQYVSFPYLLGVEISLPLLHGPFLFLYTSLLTSRQPLKRIHAIHFIPYIISLLFLVPFFSLSSQEKITVYLEEGKGQEVLMLFMFISIVFSGILYTFFSLRKLHIHSRVITEQFSAIEKINLSWLYYLIIGLSIIWFLVIFADDAYVFYAVVLYVIFIGYFGMQQTGIFTNKETRYANNAHHVIRESDATNYLKTERETEKKPEKLKYEKSKLQTDELVEIQKRVIYLMDTEHIYKNPELTLTDLADKVEVHPNTLSQVINSLEEKNFYDFINERRIEEFKRIIILPENQKFTLLALAFDCGFNSKTSFNRNFKKVTNLSPTEYLKQRNINLN